MRTEFCEAAEDFGEEIFSRKRERDGATLKCNLFDVN